MKRTFLIILIVLVASAGAILSVSFLASRGVRQKPPLSKNVLNTDLQSALQAHVGKLSKEIGDRSVFRFDELREAQNYIDEQFKASGFEPQHQSYEVSYGDVKNIIATKRGTAKPDEILVVGAHYDSRNNPGADDNASGVAGLLEIANFLKDHKTSYTVQFVAFVNGEPPFFRTSKMGSKVFTSEAKEKGKNIKGAIIIDMIGYYSDKPKSQLYPPLFSLFYPSEGNFIFVTGNFPSGNLARRVVSAFKRNSAFPIASLSWLGYFAGFDFSDHWSFWQDGYPAIMVTDTAFYRNPHYHKKSDTLETLDFLKMTKVVEGLSHAILEIAK